MNAINNCKNCEHTFRGNFFSKSTAFYKDTADNIDLYIFADNTKWKHENIRK